jgi:hypothetical protein
MEERRADTGAADRDDAKRLFVVAQLGAARQRARVEAGDVPGERKVLLRPVADRRQAGPEGVGNDLAALDAAIEDDLVGSDRGRVEFRHPLARSAVYANAGAAERRDVHAALAAASPDRDVDRRAWHLAAATVGPDAEAAAALEQAGARAAARSAYAAAAAAYEHAARLSTDEDERASLVVAAADAAWLAGDSERTLRLLDEAHGPAATYLRGQVAMRRGPVADSYRLMVAAAEQADGHEDAVACGVPGADGAGRRLGRGR